MSRSRVYLDHNATTPIRPEARRACLDAMDAGGNPSSVHKEGRKARAWMEQARGDVAAVFGAKPDRVVFTSGGTEAANMGLTPGLRQSGRPMLERLLVGATEHAAVLTGHRFGMATLVPVDPSGIIDLAALELNLAEGGPAMVALQAANNETGVLQPLAEVAALVHAQGGILVCDAVQAAGRLKWDPAVLTADAVFLSGHKIGAGLGAGALVLLDDDLILETPWLRGGGQERGLRAGTENVPAIAAFGVAAALVREASDQARLAGLRERFEQRLRACVPEVVVFGEAAPRLPNTSAFAVPGLPADRLMMAFDLGGVAVSSGSACSSGKVGRSHVLEAMGIDPDLRSGAIRVSLGWTSAEADVEVALDILAATRDRVARRILADAA